MINHENYSIANLFLIRAANADSKTDENCFKHCNMMRLDYSDKQTTSKIGSIQAVFSINYLQNHGKGSTKCCLNCIFLYSLSIEMIQIFEYLIFNEKGFKTSQTGLMNKRVEPKSYLPEWIAVPNCCKVNQHLTRSRLELKR